MILKLIVISCVSCLPFLFTLQGDFVFDDSEAIVKNKDVTSESSIDTFFNDFWGTSIGSNSSHKSYRPLTTLSFKLNYLLSQKRLVPYHFKITNLICHTLCCILLWMSYEALLNSLNNRKRHNLDVPFLSTLLFAVHPVHTEAISGIVGRADLLSAVTFFTSFLMYNKVVNSSIVLSCLYFTASVLLAALSMLFKENGITVLGFCFVYEIILSTKAERAKFGTKTTYNRKVRWSMSWSSLTRIVFLSISAVLLLIARWMVMGGTKPEFKPIDNPAAFSQDYFTKIATHNYVYSINFMLLIWPQWLCFDWSMGCVPLIQKIMDYRIIFILLLYAYGLLVLFLLCNKNIKGSTKRTTIMALSLLVVPFLPASNIFFPVGFVVAERILYIPSAGFSLLVVLGLNRIVRKTKGYFSKIIIILFYILLLLLSARSWQRSYQWQNEYKLFISGLSVCPLNAKVHYNVAKVADASNLTEWALAEYKEAIRLYPEYHQAMNNLANLLKNQKQYAAAEHFLKTAIKYKRDFPAAWMNLGIVLANTKRYGESQNAYLTALKYRKKYPDCYYNIGNLFLEINKTAEAIEAWQQALQLSPKHTLAWSNLLALLDNTGQIERALKIIPQALTDLPDSASINFVVANIYGKMNSYAEAEKYFLKAIQLFGHHAQAIHFANLGVLYHRWKKYTLAEEMYKKALQVDPGFKSAHTNLLTVQKYIRKALIYKWVLLSPWVISGVRRASMGSKEFVDFLGVSFSFAVLHKGKE